MTVDSKKVTIDAAPERVYGFASNFANYGRMVPPQIEDFKATENTCSFKVNGFMQITLEMVERNPYSSVVIAPASGSSSPMPFRITLKLEDMTGNSTQAHLSISLDGNPMMTMMIKGKLKDAADMIIEQLRYFINANVC